MSNELDSWPGGETATMNVTYTQANAAGGAVVCEVTPGSGNEFIILDVRGINSGTNGIQISKKTAAGGTIKVFYQVIPSGAGVNGTASVGLVSTSNASAGATGLGYPAFISGTEALSISQTAAGAQNDTFQVLIDIRVKGAMPTVIHSNSTNPANVSVTAGAESFTVV